MRYQQDLQVLLRERLRRLMTAELTTYAHEVRLITDWMLKQPAVRAVLDEVPTADADIDVCQWMTSCAQGRGLSWPTSSEAGRANLVWRLLRVLMEDDDASWRFAHTVSRERNLNAGLRAMTEAVVVPLFDFLGERIGVDSSVLYLLERYVRRVEWFERDRLYAEYTADTTHGEQVYDTDLRKFLFDQGLDMPFSQPRSASGLSDVLGELDTDDPLICEVKLYDGDHGKRAVATGVHQIVNYAHDYSKNAGYLVIVNLCGRPLGLPSDDDLKIWPRHVDVGGVRVYLIAVRALPTVSASKLGKATPVIVLRDELVDPDV